MVSAPCLATSIIPATTVPHSPLIGSAFAIQYRLSKKPPEVDSISKSTLGSLPEERRPGGIVPRTLTGGTKSVIISPPPSYPTCRKEDVRRRDRCSPQISEKNVDAATSIDTGVQAVVEATEFSVQFSPALVDQEISAILGVNEMFVDPRPIFSEAGVLVIPTPRRVYRGFRSQKGRRFVDQRRLESIIAAIAQNETLADQTESAPKIPSRRDW